MSWPENLVVQSMPARFVSVDRDTPMLLPPDLREWVPEDDLVHFVIEAVDRLPLESFRVDRCQTIPGCWLC